MGPVEKKRLSPSPRNAYAQGDAIIRPSPSITKNTEKDSKIRKDIL